MPLLIHTTMLAKSDDDITKFHDNRWWKFLVTYPHHLSIFIHTILRYNKASLQFCDLARENLYLQGIFKQIWKFHGAMELVMIVLAEKNKEAKMKSFCYPRKFPGKMEVLLIIWQLFSLCQENDI